MGSYKRHHYVPQWYQHRFFEGDEAEKKFYYLDLKPETFTLQNGRKYGRNSLLRWGPAKCFLEKDLYTTRFRGWESTEIEERFFGKIDTDGKKAVEYFSNFEHPSANTNAFNALLPYMSIQKLRTPKGLSYLESITEQSDKNLILFTMQEIHRMHCALWTECIWSIVNAFQSETKFILSDHPVTVYNQGCFPRSRWCRGANDPGIWLTGTHTIFPLSLEKMLVLTNLSWVRNPYQSPLKTRPNPNLFRPAMFNFMQIQTGRSLTEVEVSEINYVIKRRARRYIAASKEAWLYPENSIPTQYWDKLGNGYLFMPDPRSVTFSTEVIFGYENKRADFFDEYGRKPWQLDYGDKHQQEREWDTFHAFQGEFARVFGPRRRGRAFEFGKLDTEEDSQEYHAYHLGLERKFKSMTAKRKRR